MKTIKDILKDIAGINNISLTNDEILSFEIMLNSVLKSCDTIEEYSNQSNKRRHIKGFRPDRSDNLYNAWYWKSNLKIKNDGLLKNISYGIKNPICVNGMPMLLGLGDDSYIPDFDATIVSNILKEGGMILGKTNASDGLGLDDDDSISPFAVIKNPINKNHTTGGSSSGNAAALSNNEVDVCIGTDQGGSIRIPAAWTGVYGLRPSFGLVSYSGIVSSEMTMTVAGPMSKSVELIALTMNAISGKDKKDPRQRGIRIKKSDFTKDLNNNIKDLKIGKVLNGFNIHYNNIHRLPKSDNLLDDKASKILSKIKLDVSILDDIVINDHDYAIHVFYSIYNEGNTDIVNCNGVGTNYFGEYYPSLMEAYGKNWRGKENDFSAARKSKLLFHYFLRYIKHGKFYALGQNVRRKIINNYSKMFKNYDLLVWPTVPFLPHKIEKKIYTPLEKVDYAMNMIYNTCQSSITGFPSITIPCGTVKGLPFGLQFMSKHMEDSKLIRIASFFENNYLKYSY